MVAIMPVRPRELLTPRRFDIAVKWRFFRHLMNGDDPDSERVYRWHIEKRSGHRMRAGIPTDKWKRSVADYISSAASLLDLMSNKGFNPEYAIPVDPDGEILQGAHRLACALALGFDAVSVARSEQMVWAPAWGLEWFADKGANAEDLARIAGDWHFLKAENVCGND